jgi:hypothetical protein
MNDRLITTEQIEMLESLFDPWECLSIITGEDYKKLGEIFPEDE